MKNNIAKEIRKVTRLGEISGIKSLQIELGKVILDKGSVGFDDISRIANNLIENINKHERTNKSS